jgi:hypothetical protein
MLMLFVASYQPRSFSTIPFTIYLRRELCAIHKPGEVAVTAAVILKATQMATDRAQSLHQTLNESLAQLEVDISQQRVERLEKLREIRSGAFSSSGTGAPGGSEAGRAGVIAGTGGIDRDDPMLAWASLHQAAGLREIE